MRIGLVLGAGAYPGHAWHVGVLRGLEDALDVDARDAALVVGTSIGAITGGALRGGFAVRDLAAAVLGTPMTPEGHELAAHHIDPPHTLPPDVGPLRLARSVVPGGLGALRALAGAFDDHRNLRSLALNAVSGLLPRGTGDLWPVGHSLDVLHDRTWPERDYWVVALRTRDGHREVFGRDEAPTTTPGLAATASGAIPGVFRPVEIDGETYCDAGIGSTTHADLVLRRHDLDLVVVSVPVGAHGRATWTADGPVRAVVSAQTGHEVARLRGVGQRVVVLQPTTAAARAMGLKWLVDDKASQADVLGLARRHAREVVRKALHG